MLGLGKLYKGSKDSNLKVLESKKNYKDTSTIIGCLKDTFQNDKWLDSVEIKEELSLSLVGLFEKGEKGSLSELVSFVIKSMGVYKSHVHSVNEYITEVNKSRDRLKKNPTQESLIKEIEVLTNKSNGVVSKYKPNSINYLDIDIMTFGGGVMSSGEAEKRRVKQSGSTVSEIDKGGLKNLSKAIMDFVKVLGSVKVDYDALDDPWVIEKYFEDVSIDENTVSLEGWTKLATDVHVEMEFNLHFLERPACYFEQLLPVLTQSIK